MAYRRMRFGSRLTALLLTTLLGSSLVGCGTLLAKDVKLRGRATLAGVAAGQHAGITVTVEGGPTVYTQADGSYTASGIVNGGDDVVLTFTKQGYQTAVLRRHIDPTTSTDSPVVFDMEAVTLSAY